MSRARLKYFFILLSLQPLGSEKESLSLSIMYTNQQKVYQAVAEGRLGDAFSLVRALVTDNTMTFTPRIDELSGIYYQLLIYYAKGVDDPERMSLLEYLSGQILETADDIVRQENMRTSGSLYYGRLRYHAGIKEPTIAELIAQLGSAEREGNRKLYDELVGQLFLYLWTGTKLSNEEVLLLNAQSSYLRAIATSAISLALQERWSISYVRYLAGLIADLTATATIVARAVVGLLLAVNAWGIRAKLAREELRIVLDAASETRPLNRMLLEVVYLLTRSLGTEKLANQMQSDLMENMSRMPQEMRQMQSMSDLLESQSNPDWIKNMEESGLEEKLRTYGELQEKGADVMFSTFMHLKGDAFFRDIQNWFVPFTTDHSRVADIFLSSPELLSLAEALPTQLTDGDCYSLVISIESIPSEVRHSALASMGVDLEAQTKEMSEMRRDVSTSEEEIRYQLRNTIDSLYRFYRLFRYRTDFQSIFKAPPMIELPVLSAYMTDNVPLRVQTVNVLIEQERYAEATERLDILATEQLTNPTLYEKLGFAHAKQQDYEAALSAYQRADILTEGSRSLWIAKQMAICLRYLGRIEEAYNLYQQCIAIKPSETNLLLLAASCLMDLKRYEEARELYQRHEIAAGRLDPRAARAMAWSYFVESKLEEAEQIYRKLCQLENARDDDFLNAGHTALAMDNPKDAILLYKQANERSSDDDYLKKSFAADREQLIAVGISLETQVLVLDALTITLGETDTPDMIFL